MYIDMTRSMVSVVMINAFHHIGFGYCQLS